MTKQNKQNTKNNNNSNKKPRVPMLIQVTTLPMFSLFCHEMDRKDSLEVVANTLSDAPLASL